MNLYKLLLLAFLCCTLDVTAQTHPNLILNGGFEEWRTAGIYEKPVCWYFSVGSIEKSNQSHGGSHAVKLVAIPHTLSITDRVNNYYYMNIEGGATYRLTYWYKGTLQRANCVSTVIWCKEKRKVKTTAKRTSRDMVTDASPTEWKQKTIDFVAPQGVDCAGFYFEMKEENSDANNYLLIDDVVFKKIKSSTITEDVPMPYDVKVSAQQREIFMSWHPVQGSGIKYNILLNGRQVSTITTTDYILQKLQPNTTYEIGVQTIMPDGKKSKVAKKNITTELMMTGREDENRIPYIYQIKNYGDCPRSIELFFNDLYDVNAQIKYTLDGIPFVPVDGYKLDFNKTGKHILVVDIIESDGKAWTLEYNLNVK